MGTGLSQRLVKLRCFYGHVDRPGLQEGFKDVCIAFDTIIRKGYLICKYLCNNYAFKMWSPGTSSPVTNPLQEIHASVCASLIHKAGDATQI